MLRCLRHTYPKFQWLIPPCILFEHRERIALVNWTSGVQWVAPRCSRMASSRSQKCLLGTGAWCIWIPSTHFSIKAQQLSRKSYMLWMSLKLQVTKLAACLCLLMSFSNLSRKQLLPGTSSDSVHQRRHPFSIKYIFVKLTTPWTIFDRSLFKQILYEDEF
jgi:hypothetical protein